MGEREKPEKRLVSHSTRFVHCSPDYYAQLNIFSSIAWIKKIKTSYLVQFSILSLSSSSSLKSTRLLRAKFTRAWSVRKKAKIEQSKNFDFIFQYSLFHSLHL